jgi:16S rRNA processing protein RimM
MLVEIPRSQRTAVEGGAIYIGDLVGSELIDVAAGRASIGTIEDIEQGSAGAPLLVVRKGNDTLEVPFAAEYMVRFDADQRVLEMKLPAGLLEINAPLTDEEKGQQSGISSARKPHRPHRDS